MNNLPKSFYIAGIKIDITFVDYLPNSVGQFNDCTNEIKIAKRVKIDDELVTIPKENIINTFWHEVFHAFNYYWNNQASEEFAQVMANFMTEFLRTAEYNEENSNSPVYN